MYFAVITDKIQKKYIVVKTLYIEAFESIFIQQNKKIYSMQVFSECYNDRLERIEYIKFLRKRGYRFRYKLIFDFIK